jgi:hypothetical protein
MDGRLLQAVVRDPERTNFEPRARERLMRRHRLAALTRTDATQCKPGGLPNTI